MSVRLYGRAQGNSSHARVTAGFYNVLRSEELLSGFVGLDLGAISEDVQRERDELAGRGAVARWGLFTGGLGKLDMMLRNASHRERLVMVAPNSTMIPPALNRELKRTATSLLVPSDWAKQVLTPLIDLPIDVIAHGVDPAAYAITPTARSELWRVLGESYSCGEFRVLHFSTSDRARKGTLELVRAWTNLCAAHQLPEHARLHLVLDYSARLSLIERVAEDYRPINVTFAHRVDYSEANLAALMRQAHVICQPSRGEAFGLIPLEALCAGVPVIATLCTGHSQYLYDGMPGVVRVETGDLEPIDDYEDALAPSLRVEAIEKAFSLMYSSWHSMARQAEEHATELAERWSWTRQLAPLITRLKKATP